MNSWTSETWNREHVKYYKKDKYDPLDPDVEFVGGGDCTFEIGNSIMTMSGTYPRLYIQKEFKNVMCEMYFKRSGTDGKDSDGCIFGVRSHPKGHRDPAYYNQTHTYYGRLRYDGYADIAVEPHHTDGEYASTYRGWGDGQYRKKKKIYDGGMLADQWIGWRFTCVNLCECRILLQTEIDKGDGWEIIETVIDSYGKIPGAESTAYTKYVTDKNDIFNCSGIVFIRTGKTIKKASYKNLIIRELDESEIHKLQVLHV